MNNTLSIKGKRLGCFLLFYLFTFLPLMAQFNTDRLVMVGRSALFYEDYVLSIQYFNQAISQKPHQSETLALRTLVLPRGGEILSR